MRIPFNKPYFTGKEMSYIQDAVSIGQLSGNGKYTKKCQSYFENHYGFQKCLLTTSCTDALEMAALLLDIKTDDEIIMPSYTFVSTANAFVLRGAKIIFADSYPNHPNIDHTRIEALITPKTKAIVVVHYAGVACEMKSIMEIAQKYKLYVIEDAAQAIDSYYNKVPLGSIGHLATFSFHETKNIISGEGGMLVINDDNFLIRAEVIWEKGTNRTAFFRGEVDKYSWIDIGSSFLPSEATAAILYSQIEKISDIQKKRIQIWEWYYHEFNQKKNMPFKLPSLPKYATNNGHIFYLIFETTDIRAKVISSLKSKGILAVFHYLSLHNSNYYKLKHDGRLLENSDKYSNQLLRLPLFYELTKNEVSEIVKTIVNECSK